MDVRGRYACGEWCLKVLFNTQSLLPPRTGIGLYTQHLLEEMLLQPQLEAVAGFLGGRIFRDSSLTLQLQQGQTGSARSDEIALQKARRQGLGKAEIKKFLRGIPGAYALRQALREWQDGRGIAKLAREGFIYHEPNYIPVRYAGPMAITVHDLSHVRHPEFHPLERVAFLNSHLPAALQRADRVLTDSHFVAAEIAEVFGTPMEKITVTHLGTDAVFHPRSEAEAASTLSAFGLRYRGFVLSVATLEPRKNLERLIEAYAALPDALRRDYPLVLVGGSGWKNAALVSRVRDLEARGEAIRTGYLPRAQVLDLYAAAALFAYPSLYEGFGLPVLEAFASGVPVLTSNVSSLPEVSGGAALEVDPYSVDAIAEGMRALLDDAAMREHHAILGLERAKAFSWARCAEQTLAVYRQLA
ncbi:MAG: glycosyltransferase family 4 protein [Thiomonas delicata]